MSTVISQTIIEIVELRKDVAIIKKQHKYKFTRYKFNRDDEVVFNFCGTVKKGRITRAINHCGEVYYKILTPTGQWFQRVDEHQIITKIS